jgi:hypothetical protein
MRTAGEPGGRGDGNGREEEESASSSSPITRHPPWLKVLDRIPAEIRPEIEEVIVSDDHSDDSTYLVGLGIPAASPILPITLIRQPANLGYGGNQKAGYNLAIEHGLDIVVMLHGDGQYAPESLPEIVAPLTERVRQTLSSVPASWSRVRHAKGACRCTNSSATAVLSRFENAALGTESLRVSFRLPGLLRQLHSSNSRLSK